MHKRMRASFKESLAKEKLGSKLKQQIVPKWHGYFLQ